MTAKRFIQVIDGVKDTRTGRVLTHPLEITLKLNEINDLYDYVFNRNEGLEKENEQLKEELKELKIDNKAKDDAIDGLQSMMAHYNLEDLE